MKDLIPESFEGERDRLIQQYGINRHHASCYVAIFEDRYICHTFNGGCEHIEECRRIHMEESK